MSFIGREILYIPPTVSVKVHKGYFIVKGEAGTLKKKINVGLRVKKLGHNKIALIPRRTDKLPSAFSKEWGTLKAILWNMLLGVFQKYSIKLIFVGVGYRFAFSNKERLLTMRLGFSHRVAFKFPFGLSAKKADRRPPSFVLEHMDYVKIRTIASNLQHCKKPEPYKGKGICFKGQVVYRKEGKKKKT